MQYAILCYASEDEVFAWSKEEDEACMARLKVVQDRLAKQGRLGPVARLLPTTAATTVRKSAEPLVIDGPYAETKELIAGFWIIKANSLQEAKEWMSRAPMEPGDVLEIRQCFENEDFGDALSPEIAAREDAWRKEHGYA